MKTLYILALLGAALPAVCQTQWAGTVLEFSSQYTTAKYSAEQVLGTPNVFPQGGESALAWSPKTMDSKEEYIKVGFDQPMKAKQISIYENYNPGAIRAVYAYDAKGKEYLVQKFKPSSALRTKRILDIPLGTSISFEIAAVKVELNCKKVDGYNQIDAIGISSEIGEVKIKVNVAKEVVYDGEAERLSNAINTDDYADQNPVIAPDGKTLFFNRINHPMNIGGVDDENEIWVSHLNENGEWGTAYNIGPPLNNRDNNFVCSTSPDGKTLLVGNAYHKDGTMGKGVSTSQKKGDHWTYPTIQEIEAYYNNSPYVEYCQSTSGKYLLMAIERNDTKGEGDIYVSFRKGDNSWTEPVNLGSTVNTAAKELAPFLAPDDKTLYFSSYGHPGFGSADIYVSRRLDDTWTNWSTPQNLGTKINSDGWDAGYTIAAKGDYAYFNSTKEGSTDIYRIKLPQALRPDPVVLIRGTVRNRKTKEPVAATIAYENLQTGKEVGVALSDPKTGTFTIVLPYGYDYGYRANADQFISISEHLDLSSINEYREIDSDLQLAPIEVGEVIVLNNIFFEFGKATLKKESFPELDRVADMMRRYNTMKLEIAGHTDNVGLDEENKKLSQARADAVVQYLMEKGISSDRLVPLGYGEKFPVATNETEEGRQMNRRVEFKILRK